MSRSNRVRGGRRWAASPLMAALPTSSVQESTMRCILCGAAQRAPRSSPPACKPRVSSSFAKLSNEPEFLNPHKVPIPTAAL